MESLILYLLGCIMAHMCSDDMKWNDRSVFVIAWPVLISLFHADLIFSSSYNWVRFGKFDHEIEQ